MRRRLVYRRHAFRRLRERGISAAEVREVTQVGEVLEQYPDDTPFPSRLMFALVVSGPLHVVVADDPEDAVSYVITVYRPDPGRWDNWRVRKQP